MFCLFILSLYKMWGLAQAEVSLVSQRDKLGERGGGSTVGTVQAGNLPSCFAIPVAQN